MADLPLKRSDPLSNRDPEGQPYEYRLDNNNEVHSLEPNLVAPIAETSTAGSKRSKIPDGSSLFRPEGDMV